MYELKNPGNVDRMLQEFYKTTLAGRRSLQNPSDPTLISTDQFYNEFDTFIKGGAGRTTVQGMGSSPIIRNQQDYNDIRQLHDILVQDRQNGGTLLKSDFANSRGGTPSASTFSNRIMTLAKNEKKKQMLPISPPPSPNENLIANNASNPAQDIDVVEDELIDMLMMHKFRDFRTYRTKLGRVKDTEVEKTESGFRVRLPGRTSVYLERGMMFYSGNLNKLKPDKPNDVLKVQMMTRLYVKNQGGDPSKLKLTLNKRTPRWINKQMAITLVKDSNVKLANIKMDKELEAEVIASLREIDPSYNPENGFHQNISAEHNNSNAVPLASSSFSNNMENVNLTANDGNVTIDEDDGQMIYMEGQQHDNTTTMFDDNGDINEFDAFNSNDPLQSNSILVNGDRLVDHYNDDELQIKTTTTGYQEDPVWEDDDEIEGQYTTGGMTMGN